MMRRVNTALGRAEKKCFIGRTSCKRRSSTSAPWHSTTAPRPATRSHCNTRSCSKGSTSTRLGWNSTWCWASSKPTWNPSPRCSKWLAQRRTARTLRRSTARFSECMRHHAFRCSSRSSLDHSRQSLAQWTGGSNSPRWCTLRSGRRVRNNSRPWICCSSRRRSTAHSSRRTRASASTALPRVRR